jgi:hypothetical protein
MSNPNMNTNQQIKRAYVRHYSDNGQVTAYIEWADGSRTEGEPENGHMLALMARAQREGLNITRED